MIEDVVSYVLCPNCAELKVQGLPCKYCGMSSPDDAEQCSVCGDVKIRGQRCTSPNHNHPKERR